MDIDGSYSASAYCDNLLKLDEEDDILLKEDMWNKYNRDVSINVKHWAICLKIQKTESLVLTALVQVFQLKRTAMLLSLTP